ncbi:MAG: hypothetical protein HW421_2416 [Ignavibacteria bacterium]|nr:hypothetical protein [Ignavibacteria bacterium]
MNRNIKTILIKALAFFPMGIIFGWAFLLISCEETNTNSYQAKEIDYSRIEDYPGFIWFEPEFNIYFPDTSIVRQIKELYNPKQNKFFFYVSVTCICTKQQVEFPRVAKALSLANIPDSAFKVYSLNKPDYDYPYKSVLKIDSLPGIYIFRDSLPVYSVIDSLRAGDSTQRIEKYVLEGLKKAAGIK